MIRRTTWIILAVFVVLLGVLLYQNRLARHKPAETTPTATSVPLLIDLGGTQVDSLEIQAAGGEKIVIGKDASNLWKLVEPPSEATDVGRVEEAVTQLGGIRPVLALENDPGPDATGLKNPAYHMKAGLADGRVVSLKIGSQTAVGSSVYVQVEGGPVQVVSSSSLESIIGLVSTPPIPATPTPEAAATGTDVGTATAVP